MTEQELVRGVIAAINASGRAAVWRCHSGSVRVRGGFMRLAPGGTADQVGYLLDGSARVVGLEIAVDEALAVLRSALRKGAA